MLIFDLGRQRQERTLCDKILKKNLICVYLKCNHVYNKKL